MTGNIRHYIINTTNLVGNHWEIHFGGFPIIPPSVPDTDEEEPGQTLKFIEEFPDFEESKLKGGLEMVGVFPELPVNLIQRILDWLSVGGKSASTSITSLVSGQRTTYVWTLTVNIEG